MQVVDQARQDGLLAVEQARADRLRLLLRQPRDPPDRGAERLERLLLQVGHHPVDDPVPGVRGQRVLEMLGQLRAIRAGAVEIA